MLNAPSATFSKTQDAYERLRADLLTCRLRPGVRLKTNELCELLGVNLSAIREALSRLTAEGLVVAEPQRGFRVAPISIEELRDLTAVRIEIEGLCIARTISVGDIGWESRLVASFHRLSHTPEREPDDPTRLNEAFAVAHADFHEALVGACDSPWLMRLRSLLYAQTERYRRLSVPLGREARDLNREHQGLMEAALARDVKLCQALMARHLDVTARVLVEEAHLDAHLGDGTRTPVLLAVRG